MSLAHLPAEIHALISSHLSQETLPSYRLTSKRLADIGAQHLFRAISFHASYASLNRVQNLGSHPHLKEYVQCLTWDTSYLNLEDRNYDDWKDRVCTLRAAELAEIWESWHAQGLDHDTVSGCMERFLCEAYERYIESVLDDLDVRIHYQASLPDLLAQFPKLKTIVVDRKPYAGPDAAAAAVEDLASKPAELVKRGMLFALPRVPYRYAQDMVSLVAALRAAQASAPPLEVHLENLHFDLFTQSSFTFDLQPIDVLRISRLHLHFALTRPSHDPLDSSMNVMNCRCVLHHGHLKAFLQKFKGLRALGLDFEYRSCGNGRAAVELRNVFGDALAWPKLSELTILHADTSECVLKALLAAHAGSLRRLALGDVCLDPPGSWEALLTSVQPSLSLEEADFSYFLFDARIENFVRGKAAMVGWYVDGEESVELGRSDLGERLGSFMVEGGTCPLQKQRKIVRVVGRLEDGSVEDWVEERHSSVVT
ncbi:hypothetical protein BU23DRAFT_177585 [Bimuria novae-zelandiae CBS 107.79]|uniref:F-box domain-containing protein n=1 Tax=Bimuria novae-zelandiae CBS 107.79 TaxID=1447943 RepID=A0A6A5V2Y8_9PLEO|nr:hypothetical protein BU23DRAFT_177585 [Bimuria novae-zelandiae CBS 107.79]